MDNETRARKIGRPLVDFFDAIQERQRARDGTVQDWRTSTDWIEADWTNAADTMHAIGVVLAKYGHDS